MHVLDRRVGSMLVAPAPCEHVLAEILAEKTVVARDRLMRLDDAALAHRGYCRHCLGTLRTKDQYKGRLTPGRGLIDRHDDVIVGPQGQGLGTLVQRSRTGSKTSAKTGLWPPIASARPSARTVSV